MVYVVERFTDYAGVPLLWERSARGQLVQLLSVLLCVLLFFFLFISLREHTQVGVQCVRFGMYCCFLYTREESESESH